MEFYTAGGPLIAKRLTGRCSMFRLQRDLDVFMGTPAEKIIYTSDIAILFRLLTKNVRRKSTPIKTKIGEKSIPPILTGIRLRIG